MGRRRRGNHEADEMHEDLLDVREIQRKLYPPTAPQIPGFEIAGLTRPCGIANGDCLDYVSLLDETIGVVIADVTGHGLRAALVAVQARAYLRAFAMTDSHIEVIMGRANQALAADRNFGLFVTCLLVQIDPARPVLRYVNAGHPPGLVIRGAEEIYHMTAESPLLGAISEATFEEARLDLRTGDVVVLYTDGVTEARSQGGAEFGYSGLVNAVKEAHHRSAHSVCEHVLRAVAAHLRGRGQRDDLTVLVAKVVREPAATKRA
jgi:sigma-B regulation protein RsbU (phosphoserine phosphatase)